MANQNNVPETKINILRRVQHLVEYACWAYMNDNGDEFRMTAKDLHGEPQKLQITTPFLYNLVVSITPNTHLHLGIRNGNTLVLAFRGTDVPMNLKDVTSIERWWGCFGNTWTDFTFGMTKLDWKFPGRDGVLDGVLVHEGFLLAFNNLLKDGSLMNSIHALLSKDPENIEICGHSLGGALATLCALWLKLRFRNAKITCVPVGSPRVGNAGFQELFHRLDICCYRIVNDGDPIPTIPDRYSEAIPIGIPASHPDGKIRSRKYQHVGTPVWLHVDTAIILPHQRFAGQDPPEIESEEHAGDLSWLVKFTLKAGGFIPYWTVRGTRIARNIWRHDYVGYALGVHRILKREDRQLNGIGKD